MKSHRHPPRITAIYLLLLLPVSLICSCRKEDSPPRRLGKIPETIPVVQAEIGLYRARLLLNAKALVQKQQIVSSPSRARVKSIQVESGERVRRGDLLLSLDTDTLEEQQALIENRYQVSLHKQRVMEEEKRQAERKQRIQELLVEQSRRALSSAEERLRLNKEQYARGVELEESGLLSPSELQEYHFALQEAQRKKLELGSVLQSKILAAVPSPLFRLRKELELIRSRGIQLEQEMVERRIQAADLYSPIDGIISALYIRIGEVVEEHQKMVLLYKPSKIRIALELPPDLRDIVAIGNTVFFHEKQGQVERIINRVDPRTAYLSVYVGGVEGPCPYAPGESFTAELESNRKIRGVPLLPEMVVQERYNSTQLLLAVEQKAVFRTIETERDDAGRVFISAGIQQADLICLRKPEGFYEGITIRTKIEEVL